MTRRLTHPYIHAWAGFLGSGQTYIAEQVALAVADDAPVDVIYANTEQQNATSVRPAKRDDPHTFWVNGRVWHRAGGISIAMNKERVDKRAFELGYQVPA